MRSNTVRHPVPDTSLAPVHPAHRTKVVCIYCYRTLGMTGSARKVAQLLHTHDCIEARLARQPAAPPPYN